MYLAVTISLLGSRLQLKLHLRVHLSLPCSYSSCSMSSRQVLKTYKQLLRAAQHYPSSKRTQVTEAIQAEFRENIKLEGEALTRALWLAEMELKRMQTWLPTAKRMRSGSADFDINL